MKVTFQVILIAGLAAGTLVGCKKKEAKTGAAAGEAAPEASAAKPASKLPGEDALREAMAKKDYQRAVASVLSIRGSITQEQWPEWQALYGEVRDFLVLDAGANPKAMEAMNALQAVVRGR